MKLKKLIGLIAVSALAFGANAAMAADSDVYITDAGNERFSVFVPEDSEGVWATLAAARFDDEGRFVSVDTGKSIVFPDDDSYKYSRFRINEYIDTGTKLMLWSYDDDMKPLSESHSPFIVPNDYRIGIVEDVYVEDGVDYVTMISSSGKESIFAVEPENAQNYAAAVYADLDGIKEDNTGREKKFITERVAEYYTDENGYLNINAMLTGTYTASEYDADANSLGSVYLGDGSVNMIDMTDYYVGDKYDENGMTGEYTYQGRYYSLDYQYLEQGSAYPIYTFDSELSGAQFIMVMGGLNPLNVNLPMAVYCSEETADVDGTKQTVITAYQYGEQIEINTGNTEPTGMTSGDPFFYTYDDDRNVNKIINVFDDGIDLDAGYDVFYNYLISGDTPFEPLSDEAEKFAEWAGGDRYSQIVFGAVSEIWSNSIGIIEPKDFVSGTIANVVDTDSYIFTDDMNIYIYDYAKKPGNRISSGTMADIVKTYFTRDSYVDYGSADANDKMYVDFAGSALTENLTSDFGMVNFVLAKVVNDTIMDILVINPR